jgi:hypothetical protein
MNCLVRLFYGGSVRKEDGEFENMEYELEMFDVLPRFSDLVLRVQEKFDGKFTLKGRFDSGKSRAHYVLMPLRNEAHWSWSRMVLQGLNVMRPEVVVENGHRKDELPSFDGGGGDELEWRLDVDATPVNMVLDSQLTQEPLHRSAMAVNDSMPCSGGVVNNDFDVGSY